MTEAQARQVVIDAVIAGGGGFHPDDSEDAEIAEAFAILGDAIYDVAVEAAQSAGFLPATI